MRAYEFLSERPITEAPTKSSDRTQYNSELGCLVGMIEGATFDSFIAGKHEDKLVKPEEIVALAKAGKEGVDSKKWLYVKEKFNQWIDHGKIVQSKINYEGKLDWDGVGQGNKGKVADVKFGSGTHSGVSIKDDSGITLTNTTAKELGLDDENGDVFLTNQPKLYEKFKMAVLNSVFKLTKNNAVPERINPKGSAEIGKGIGNTHIRAIQWNNIDYLDDIGKKIKASAEKLAIDETFVWDEEWLKGGKLTKKDADAVKKQIPMFDNLPHLFPKDTYTVWFGAAKTWKRQSWTEEQLIAEAKKGNSKVQRVFGDWYQQLIHKKPENIIEEQKALFKAFADSTIETIQKTVTDPAVLSKLLQMAEKRPYYYYHSTSTKKKPEARGELYDVPGTGDTTAININLKPANPANQGYLVYKEVKGTSQMFHLYVVNDPDATGIVNVPSEDDCAIVQIFVRYANGLWAANPTVRIQSLKNPEHLLWNPI